MSHSGIDYYKVLGLAFNAEPAVIKAAYKALMTKYHPDKDNGDAIKAQQINDAYDTLICPRKKAEYDEARTFEDEFEATFTSESPFNEEMYEEEWKIAKKYHFHIVEYYDKLSKLSYQLGFSFKIKLLESQTYDTAVNMYNELRKNYLKRYFGENWLLQNFAEQLILSKEKSALLELNKAIIVLGNSVSAVEIQNKMLDEFPHIKYDLKRANLNGKFHNGRYSKYDIHDYVTLIGGTLEEKGIFSFKFVLTVDSMTIEFPDHQSLVNYLLKSHPL